MRILFLSHYFPPEVNAPASRTFEHCREWVKNGHQVTIVTCAPNHPGGKVYAGYRNKLYQWDERDGIKVLRLWTYLAANEGFIKRIMNYVSFMISCIFAIPFMPKSDIVITTSPQFFNGLAGYFVSRLKRIPWLLEIRDLWPESILAVGAIKNKKVIRMLEGIETFAYKKADRIVSVTESFTHHIQARGVDPDKIQVIKNGVDLSLFNDMADGASLRDELGIGDRFVASYVGTHGMAHGLETVLRAADRLRDNKNIVFLLVGDGAEKANLSRLKEEMELDNVIMVDQQPKEKMPEIWAITDVSLVLLKKLDLFLSVIPSKIFESMAMGKPIVLGVMGESAEIINDAGSGIPIEPENDEELANTVEKLFVDQALVSNMCKSGKEYVVKYFDRKKLAKVFEHTLESTIVAEKHK